MDQCGSLLHAMIGWKAVAAGKIPSEDKSVMDGQGPFPCSLTAGSMPDTVGPQSRVPTPRQTERGFFPVTNNYFELDSRERHGARMCGRVGLAENPPRAPLSARRHILYVCIDTTWETLKNLPYPPCGMLCPPTSPPPPSWMGWV
jgi:hypothetical protein